MEFSEIVQMAEEKDMGPWEYRIDGQGYKERIKTLKDILDRPIWHQIFLLCCVVAASLDPLFFYIPIINDQKKCLGMDEKLKKTVLVLRSIMDVTYIFHIIFQIFYGYFAYASESREFPPKRGKVILRIGIRIRIRGDNRRIIKRINWWIIIIDILCVLPIPQVIILVYFSKMKGSESLNWRKFLNFILLFQFVPRIFRIYHSCQELTKNLSPRKIAGASWVKGLFNFFLYIIASHLFGAIWYFFSVHRESECWQHACKGSSICNQSSIFCKHRYNIVNDPIIGYLNLSCPLIPPSRFDFGMFTPALQSGIVNSMDFLRKFFYCFAWALRNLSSFGSNLQTSTDFWESLFSAAITIIGLLLFIYLIGNLQTYLQFSANYSEKRRRKIEKKEVEIDAWIISNEIPPDMGKELKDRVRKKMDENKDENKDVNLENLVNVLPNQSKTRITWLLCSHILEKVPQLQNKNYQSIDIFIDHLKPVIFNEHTEIFKEGDPLRQMLFFIHGSASVYSRDTTPSKLKIGDFYGAELLDWALETPSPEAPSTQFPKLPSPEAPSTQFPKSPSPEAPLTQFPKSQKTVKTDTKVEAFALDAQDMKKIAKSWSNETNMMDEQESTCTCM